MMSNETPTPIDNKTRPLIDATPLIDDVNLSLDNFEGPIDLLYSLVKDKQMDIMDVNIEDLATAYLEIIDKLKDRDLNLASEYLVMAATLLQIKARELLKTPEAMEQIDPSKADILRQLIEHQKFKNIAQDLRAKEIERKAIFIKTQSPLTDYQYEIDQTQLDGSSDPIKLIINLRKMFERTHAQNLRKTTIDYFNLSPAQRRLEVLKLFEENPHAGFAEIFSVPSLNHFVITLVTVLDMALKQELNITQQDQYGSITITKGVINDRI